MKAALRHWNCDGKLGGNPEHPAGRKPGLKPTLPDEFGLLVGRDESEPVELVGVGLQALDLRIRLHWFGWRPRLDILVLHFFIATDNVRQLFPLVLVYFIVVIQGRFTRMACYFTDDIARLAGTFQFILTPMFSSCCCSSTSYLS